MIRPIYILFLFCASILLTVACSDPEAEAELARRQTTLESYQSQIRKVNVRLDSAQAADARMRGELDSLDMAR